MRFHRWLVCVWGVGVMMAAGRAAESVIDQQQLFSNGRKTARLGTTIAQTFRTGMEGQLEKVELFFFFGQPEFFPITVTLVETIDGRPEGPALGRQVVSDFLGQADLWYEFAFPQPVYLASNRLYGIVIYTDSPFSGVSFMGSVHSNVYPEGQLWEQRNGGEWEGVRIWDDTPPTDQADCRFITHMIPGLPPVWLRSLIHGGHWPGGVDVPLVAQLARADPGATVHFYQGDVWLGSDPAEPYEQTLTNPVPGRFELWARAEDSSGNNSTSAVVTLTVIVAGPANDDFANRLTLTGSYAQAEGDLIEATTEPGEPSEWTGNDGGTVWWRWISTITGSVFVSVRADSGQDLGVSAYYGSAVDALGFVGGGRPEFYFQAVQGREYQFVVESFEDPVDHLVLHVAASDVLLAFAPAVLTTPTTVSLQAQGEFTQRVVERVDFYAGPELLGQQTNPPYRLEHLFNEPGYYYLWAEVTDAANVRTRTPDRLLTVRPSNDNFNNAVTLIGYSNTVFATTLAATYGSYDMRWGDNQGGHSIWYAWTPPATGICRIYGTGPGSGLLINAFAANGSGSLQLVGHNAFSAPNSPPVFQVLAGVTYYISVDGFFKEEGPVEVTVLLTPDNDDLANAALVRDANASIYASNRGATREPGEPTHADTAEGRSVWWRWVPPTAATATLKVTSTDLDPLVAVYQGSSFEDLEPIAAAEAPDGSGVTLTFDVVGGETYYIAVDGRHLAGTEFTLELALDLLQIITPQPGSIFKAPAHIAIRARPPDGHPGLKEIQFVINDYLVASGQELTYSWQNAPAGSHRLVVRGIDANNRTNVSTPVVVLVYTNDVMPVPQIAAGFVTSYAITAAGQLYFWGPSGYDDFNLHHPPLERKCRPPWTLETLPPELLFAIDYWCPPGPLYLRYPEPARYPEGVTEWKSVTAGSWAIGNNGVLYALGRESVPLPPDATRWLWLHGGQTIADNGKYYVNGEEGFPQATNQWVMIRGGFHLDTRGMLYQRTETAFQAVPFPPGATAWKDISVSSHQLALSSDGQLYSMGYNYSGQLGLGDFTPRDQFQRVELPQGVNRWIAIAVGGDHSLAIADTGRLYAWGRNWEYQLGLGNGAAQAVSRPAAVDFPAGVTAWTAVAAGYTHSLGLGNDCQAYGWGANDQAQLGLGTLPPQVVPRVISGLGSLCGNTLLQADAQTTWLAGGTYAIRFPSILNRAYTIQYSPDAVRWVNAYPSLTGTGEVLEWIDDGPPKTERSPASEPVRFYRVVHSN